MVPKIPRYAAIIGAAGIVLCAAGERLSARDATRDWFTRTPPPAIVSMFSDDRFPSSEIVLVDFELADSPPATPEATTTVQATQPRPWRIAVGARAWFTRGQAEMRIAGTIGPPLCDETRFVDVLSELQWKAVDSVVTELNADLLVYGRLIIQCSVGFGEASTGTFDDYDYCAPGRQELLSHTFHPVHEGELRSFSVDLGVRYFESRWCSLEALVGHQHFSERYAAVDGVDLYPGSRTAIFQGQRVITQEYTWNSFRVGGSATLHILPRVDFRGTCFIAPATNLRLTDVHHLRDDLRQDPSIVALAGGGWGLSARAAVTCRVWRGMFVELGYQVLLNESGTGESTARTHEGDAINPINAQMYRHGFTVGGRYEF